MSNQLTDAIAEQVAWKSHEVHAYAVALVDTGLRLRRSSVPFFGSDDVPEDEIPAGRGIAGSVATMLRRAHVIRHYDGSLPAEGIRGGRRASKRESRNAAWICLYELCSETAAVEFLRRHGVEKTAQLELGI